MSNYMKLKIDFNEKDYLNSIHLNIKNIEGHKKTTHVFFKNRVNINSHLMILYSTVNLPTFFLVHLNKAYKM